MRPRTAADALLYPVGWLRDLGLTLEVRCACGAHSEVWIRGLLDRRHDLATRRLGDIVAMLRCKRRCGGKPVRLILFDVPERARVAAGYPCAPPWELVLVGEDVPAD